MKPAMLTHILNSATSTWHKNGKFGVKNTHYCGDIPPKI